MTTGLANKPKLVLDTNIYVSALVFAGLPLQIVNLGIDEKVSLAISRPIIAEILGVLTQKFSYPAAKIRETQQLILDTCHLVEPKTHLKIIQADPTDNRVLECALEARADYIISGDKKHLLRLKQFRAIPILPPATFLKTHSSLLK